MTDLSIWWQNKVAQKKQGLAQKKQGLAQKKQGLAQTLFPHKIFWGCYLFPYIKRGKMGQKN